jgi:hypothetical protein
MFRILFLLLPSSLFCFGAQVSVGPLNTTNPLPRHTVSGVVTNAVTGEPIRRALVQMNGQASGAVLTGADGRFQFADVPEGPAVFVAQKPGFSDPRFTPGSQWAMPNASSQVDSGKNDFHLTLLPNSRIVGHITDPDGEPLENVQVQILYEQIWQGRKQWQQRSAAETDEDGSYRAEDLTPGRYVIFISGHSFPLEGTSAPSEVLAPRYYPDVPDLASTQPLDLRPGAEFRADFRVRMERGYRLTAQVSGVPASMGLSFSLQNSSGQNVWFQGFDQAKGQIVVPALPSGVWTLFLNANDAQGHGYQTRQEIAVNHADVTNLAISLRPAAAIPVTINHSTPPASETAASQNLPVGGRLINPGIAAMLNPADPSNMQSYGLGMQGDPPVMEFRDVAPGKYKLDIQGFGSECVESAWYGSVDLTRDYLLIDPSGGTQALTINLRSDCATLTAKLRPEEKAPAGFVLVVPTSSMGEPKVLQLQGQSSSNPFNPMNNPSLTLSPGTYQVFAFTSLEGLEYANPDVLRNYPSQSIELGAGQKTELTVEISERKEN